MKLMKVKFKLSTGIEGTDHEEEVELPDESTDEQIENEWQNWAWGYIDGSWTKE